MTEPLQRTPSWSLNRIQSISSWPLMNRMGPVISNSAAVFEGGARKEQTRFATVVVATMLTAAGVWGFNVALSRVPFHFVKRTLLPTCQFACKAGLAWVIFKALEYGASDGLRNWGQDDDDKCFSRRHMQDPAWLSPLDLPE